MGIQEAYSTETRDGDVFTFGSDITFQCDRGYTVFGSTWIVCQADGDWSGSMPYCSREFYVLCLKRCPFAANFHKLVSLIR